MATMTSDYMPMSLPGAGPRAGGGMGKGGGRPGGAPGMGGKGGGMRPPPPMGTRPDPFRGGPMGPPNYEFPAGPPMRPPALDLRTQPLSLGSFQPPPPAPGQPQFYSTTQGARDAQAINQAMPPQQLGLAQMLNTLQPPPGGMGPQNPVLPPPPNRGSIPPLNLSNAIGSGMSPAMPPQLPPPTPAVRPQLSPGLFNFLDRSLGG